MRDTYFSTCPHLTWTRSVWLNATHTHTHTIQHHVPLLLLPPKRPSVSSFSRSQLPVQTRRPSWLRCIVLLRKVERVQIRCWASGGQHCSFTVRRILMGFPFVANIAAFLKRCWSTQMSWGAIALWQWPLAGLTGNRWSWQAPGASIFRCSVYFLLAFRWTVYTFGNNNSYWRRTIKLSERQLTN